MKKIKYLIKRICNMNFNNFFNTLNDVHKKTGKNKVYIFFDMIICGFKYQAGYIDYNLFEMYNMNRYERSTVITRGINNEIIKKYNDPEYMKIFNDKIKFNERFNKYLKRDWLELTGNNKKEFAKFCEKHPKFVAKPTKESCGNGVEIIDSTDKKIYDFICDRDISVMRGRRCKLTGGKWGDVRLGRCIRSDSDACGRYRIRGNEKFGEEGRKYCFDRSVRSGGTGWLYRFRKLLRSCNLVRLVPDQCDTCSRGDDKEQIRIIYI